tara:strand:- start:930 stop:1691 length:762 start_codon:yes stop_codon:yes gene_type:complete
MKFIAEIGVNHLGSEEFAVNYCVMLANTGVEAVTLQIREDSFYDESSPWKKRLSKDCYFECRRILKASGKTFGIAISDLEVAQRNVDLSPDFWKILSWGIKDIPLISFLVDTGIPVYVSTGISDINEIKSVAGIFGQKVGFIHTQLSTDIEDVNLAAILAIKDATGCDVSFGLHCDNFDVINVAIPYKPHAVFFYVKEKENHEYPDGSYAILVSDIDMIMHQSLILSEAVGDGVKHAFVPKTLSDSDKPKSLK